MNTCIGPSGLSFFLQISLPVCFKIIAKPQSAAANPEFKQHANTFYPPIFEVLSLYSPDSRRQIIVDIFNNRPVS
jgi:hypothetical protein